ncbi:unnamed protein product [Sphagnum troendelagicum]|uniref:Uncharacterized protein n=1 Tax=Sphagnum troendelagicum TaxID=128251 RepID=A0ABP0UDC1_9BRYO
MREHNWEESISTGFAPLVNTFIATLLLLQVPLLWNDEEEQQGRADSQRVFLPEADSSSLFCSFENIIFSILK